MGMLSYRQFLAVILLLLTFQLVSLEAANAYICWDPLSVDEPVSDDTKSNGKSDGKRQNDKGNNSDGGVNILNLCPTPTPSPATPTQPGTPSVSPTNSANGTYSITWSPASSMVTSGTNAWGYQLAEYRGGSYVKTYTTSPTSNSHSVSGNSDGNYRYKVRGCNLDLNTGVPKCGSYSSLSTTNLVRNKPSTPAKPSVGSLTSTGSVSVSWIKPSGSVSFYQLQRRLNSGSWVTVWNTDIQNPDTTNSSNQLEGTSYTVKNLTDGHWTFRVRACNTYTWACSGFSSISSSVKARLIPGVPSKPIPETLSSITGTYSVSWGQPSGTVTKYFIRELKNGVSYSTNQTSSRSFSYTNRPDGSYTYQVRACNEENWACSDYGAISSAVNVLHKPGTPSSISGPAGLNKSGNFEIDWGSASGQVAYYQTAHRHQPIGGTFSAWTYVKRGTALSHAYSGLSDGEWDFAVRACNASGCSGWRYIEPHVQVLRVPGVPSSIAVSNKTNSGDHTINWGASTGNSITYQLNERLKPYGGSTYGSWSGPVNSGTERSESFSGRADGEWDYRVRACNDAGCSGYRSISPKVNVLKPPLAPTGVSVDASSDNGSYTLSWSSSIGVVDEYIYAESPNYDDWKFVGDALSTVISGKGDGSWSYKVKACNDTSCSPSSLSNTVVVNHPTPAMPGSISVPPQVSESRYQINWDASSSSFVDHYQISQQHESNGWSSWTNVSGTTAQVKVTAAGNWTHRVRACNKLPDNTRKCSSAKTSSTVDVQLPANWAWTGGEVEDQVYGHNEGLISDETVGAVEGSAGVSGGAATYNIPIVIPPGRKGMQPNVSLNYSSRSGNGIAGVGWSLSAGSSIHRCSATNAQDGYTKSVTFEPDDKLCLDGQRLIVVSGTYGQSGAEYRTELDSFAKITQLDGGINSGATFEVRHKNNRTSYYGDTSDSRHVPEGLTHPLTWGLSKQEDSSRNRIDYIYQNFGDGEYHIKEILYTGSGSLLGNRKVSLEYESRTDISRSYNSGGSILNTKRLKKVKTYVGSSLVRTYTLTYLESNFSNRSLLSSVQECASSKCLKPTTFDVYHPSLAWEAPNSPTQSLPELNSIDSNDQTKYMDVNGDGVMELLYLSSKYSGETFIGYSVKIYSRSNASGEYGPPVFDSENDDSPISSGIYHSPKGDLNGDGITDFFIVGDDRKLRLFQFNKNFEVLPLIETNVVLPETFVTMKSRIMPTLQILDLNGDGHHDFTYIDDDNKVYYYLNLANGEAEFQSRYMLTQLQTTSVHYLTQREVPSYRDVDGDGVIDIIRTWQNGSTSNVMNISFGAISATGKLIISETKSSSQLGLPSNNYHNQYLWGDFNGDGLQDFVRATKVDGIYDWKIQENNGARSFLPEKSLGTSRGLHTDSFFLPNNYGSYRIQALWGGAHAVDIDSDGVDELLVATGSSDNVCVNFEGSPKGTVSEPSYLEVCNNDLHKDKATFVSGQREGEEISIDWSRYDVRRFNWSILDFKQTVTDGTSISREILNIVKAPLSSYSLLSGKRSESLQIEDLDNNGYLDFSYHTLAYDIQSSFGGIKPIRVGGIEFSPAKLIVKNHSTSTGYFEQKNKMGLGSDLGKLADTNYQVENGLGQKFKWNYAPLSRPLSDRVRGDAFYDVPNERYTESDLNKDHFYFTSSMYVVSSSYKSNGTEQVYESDELNETQYNYREAVYNRAGRGFQGFRTIIVDDIESGIRSVSDFHQIFPLAGKVEEVRTCLTSDDSFECNDNPLSKTYITAYNVRNTAPNVYWVYPGDSRKYQYDLYNRNNVISSERTIIGNSDYAVDNYGNILVSTNLRFNGFDTTRVITRSLYDVDVAGWWLNKLDSKTIETAKMIYTSSDLTSTGTADNEMWSKTVYGYNTTGYLHRIPTTVTSTASGSSQKHITSLDLNAYGLTKSVTQQGDGSTSSDLKRVVTTTYSNDGYFPKTITNDKNQTTTTIVSAKHGQPTSVTDANGNIVNYTYDAFGRVKSTSVPGGKLIESGYQRCYSTCPDATAVYFEFTQQEGSPTVKTYKDMFNRAVMVETNGFNASSSIFTSVDYDELGRKVFESTPSFHSSNTTGTRYKVYDAIGRLVSKETDRENGNTYYTSYSYSEHETDVTVNDGGIVLSMSRTYGGDGKLIQTRDAIGGVTNYAYDSMGNPIKLQDAKGNSILASYNGFGHKTKVDDPNMGVKTFTYNTFGEVEKEIDANGNTLTMQYDGLGRLKLREVNGLAQAQYIYDTRYKGKGLPATEIGTGIQKEFYYDIHSRPNRQVTTIDSTPYETLTEYDANFGRVKAVQYPGSNIKVGYSYNQYGYQTKTFNADSGFVYQEVTARDHFLNAVETLKNAGTLAESRNYDSVTGQLKSIVASAGGVQKHFLDYWYGSFGNLAWQEVQYENGAKTSREDYSYDNLHRLTYSTRSFTGVTHSEDPITYSYDQVGNLLVKTDYATTINYGGTGKANAGNAGPNAVLSITKPDNSTADYTYDNNGNMLSGDGKTITYNAFNKPVSISKGGINSTFAYGADLMRFKQVKTGLPSGDETTIYLDKMVEIVKQGGSTITKTYIDDVAIVRKEEIVGQALPDHKIRFTLRDRLGSVVTLVDHNNIITEDRSYDPFGKPRTAGLMDVAPPTLSAVVGGEPFTNRGFTDHEHLDDAELIHMNGRAYDYNLGRFLSVDPFIQSPGNSQSMNPYSYIMNNPLAGTDPSGYAAECEDALGKGCGDDEPKKERKKFKRGGSSWNTVYDRSAVSNGAEVEHSVEAKGTPEEIEQIGSELEDKGYELTAGMSNADGTNEVTYTRTYSGGLDDIGSQISGTLKNISDIAMVSGLTADAGGQLLGVAGSAKFIPQFSPAVGGVASWSATWGSANGRAFMQLSGLEALGSRLRVASRALGFGAVGFSTASNMMNPNYSKSDVVWKFAADSAVTYIAFKAASYGRFGGLYGLAIGASYGFIDYRINQNFGGWKNFANYHIQNFESGVSTFNHNMDYIQQKPNEAMHRMFNVPNMNFNMEGR